MRDLDRNVLRSHQARERRKAVRFAAEIAHRYGYDPVRMERHARLLSALDPTCAEAIRAFRLPARSA